MLLIEIIRFIRGYVTFTVKGKFVERFLNLAVRNDIPIWNSYRADGIFTGSTLAYKYKKIRTLVRKTQVSVHIVERHGLPFLLKRYRKRSGLVIGFVIFFLCIFASGLFVWEIEVSGNKEVSTQEIIELIQEQGLNRGKLKASVDVTKIEEELCLHFHEIGWAAVNLIGTVADIQIEECEAPPVRLDDQYPCNIIASKGGQIVSMDVYDGQKVIGIKSTVKKGDIIVSGITRNRSGGNLLRHARAKVLAEYGETKIVNFPITQTIKVVDGAATNYKYLILGKKYFPLFLGRIKWESSFERVYTRPAIFCGIKLPFDLRIIQVIPAKQQEITVSKEKAKQMALLEIERFEHKTIPEREIISKQTEGKITNQTYQITVKYVFRENIGEEEEIFIEKQHNT